MLEKYRYLVTGDLDVQKLCTKFAIQLDDPFEDYSEIKDRDTLYRASDHLIASLPKAITAQSFLMEKTKFKDAVRTVLPDGDAKEIQRLTDVLFREYQFAVSCVQNELIQTSLATEEYESIASESKMDRLYVDAVVDEFVRNTLTQITDDENQ